ncbi:hypothetical protein DDR33_24195 [Pararcticibacter amylolyticus]|uniref:RHS repeat protein n=1 Tax=Pararcticibacter amylolyticus TaxID=2173175 RepID=A0A2U2P9K3_9SPHI|nr:hypothetical protein DDR33_24195 [Pararcticibacter amylolyticus]
MSVIRDGKTLGYDYDENGNLKRDGSSWRHCSGRITIHLV